MSVNDKLFGALRERLMHTLSMTTDLISIGQRLREARESLGLSQQDMGEAIGLGEGPGAGNTYGNYERGTRTIDFGPLAKLCEITGYLEKYIISGQGPKTKEEQLFMDLSMLEGELAERVKTTYETALAEQITKKLAANLPLTDSELKIVQARLRERRTE
jgi:transcriptional regulator with XRE-family HTH domain